MVTEAEAPPKSDFKTPAQIAQGHVSHKTGKPLHVSAVHRWINHGKRLRDGRVVRLKAVRLPGGWVSTDEWINEFIATLTADRAPLADRAPPCSSAARRRAHERASRELDRLGI